jgi:hypothetical protein
VTTTDTAAALEAAIAALAGQAGCALHHRDELAVGLRAAVAAHVAAEAATRTATLRRGLDEARGLRHVVCDRCGEPIQIYAINRVGCPCVEAEVTQAPACAPDVARRLVEEFERACDAWQYHEAEARTDARTALLRALGVEA